MSLISPSFNKVLRAAHETECAHSIRELVKATHIYADDADGQFFDLGRNRHGGGNRPNFLYWAHGYWRNHLTQNYELTRAHFYSPTNDKWNNDSFYYYNNSNYMVMGRFYFGSKSQQARSHNAIPASKRGNPTFATHNYDFPAQRVLWTDLNRKYLGYFINPTDPSRRHGSNHLYDSFEHPSLSHNGMVDGSMDTPDSFSIERRMVLSGVEYYW